MKLRETKGFKGEVLLPENELIIFFGQNNCGKSSILYSVNSTFGETADYISPSRFNLSNDVAVTSTFDAEIQQQRSERKRYDQNICELTAPDSTREIFTLSDKEREYLTRWHNEYFGELKIEKLKPDNSYSPPKVTIDGIMPSQQGTGSRAILPILIKLLNPNVKILCIDEPELGIEPKTQKRLFELIRKVSKGEEGLPQKKIVISTHSHLFIDKENYKNNFKVTKIDGIVTFNQINDNVELQNAVFSLLGNDPSDLFFPSNILLVEGKSDEIFLKRIYELMISKAKALKKNIAFHYCGGYDKADYAVEAVIQMLKTQGYMPIYKDKICGLFDKPTKNTKLVEDVRSFANDVNNDRFILLNNEAIEYYYPLEAIRRALGEESITQDQINSETERFLQQYKSNGTGNYFTFKNIKKVDLATRVSLNINDLNEIDKSIVDLIAKCVSLSF